MKLVKIFKQINTTLIKKFESYVHKCISIKFTVLKLQKIIHIRKKEGKILFKYLLVNAHSNNKMLSRTS